MVRKEQHMSNTTKARLYATTAVVGITGLITVMGAPWKLSFFGGI